MEEIQLVFDTLTLIYRKRELINQDDSISKEDMRELIFNLIDFMNNFTSQLFGAQDEVLKQKSEELKDESYYRLLIAYQLLIPDDQGDVAFEGFYWFSFNF